MALGPILLGYGHPTVNEAIERQLQDGIVFTLPHPVEVEVAERIAALVPCADRVRFAKNGSDATTASVRLARACTGRDGVIVCGYHGWQDWYIGTTSRRSVCRKQFGRSRTPFVLNDLGSLDAALERQAGTTRGSRAGARRRRRAGGGLLAGCPRPRACRRRARGLRRDHHRLPACARRRAGALRRRPGPRRLRQGARQRHADRRARRESRVHGPARGRVFLGDARQ